MFFFLFHHLFQSLMPEMADLRRNCLTLILGSVCYFIFYGLLREYPLFGFLKVLRDFWWYLATVDIITMAMLYRGYYGRSIIHELTDHGEADGLWNYDEDKHQYQRTDLADKERFFRGKVATMSKIEDTLEQAESQMAQVHQKATEIDQIQDKVNDLEENLDRLQTDFLYRPDGPLVNQMVDESVAELQSVVK